eukprot:14189960-Heterocapsa_arctica.AAC.1
MCSRYGAVTRDCLRKDKGGSSPKPPVLRDSTLRHQRCRTLNSRSGPGCVSTSFALPLEEAWVRYDPTRRESRPDLGGQLLMISRRA